MKSKHKSSKLSPTKVNNRLQLRDTFDSQIGGGQSQQYSAMRNSFNGNESFLGKP